MDTNDNLEPIEMHVIRGFVMTGEIVKIHDYRKPNSLDEKVKRSEFVGMKLSNGCVIHIPTDRGAAMKQLANKVMKIWSGALDVKATNTAIKALLFEAEVAVMITEIKRGPDSGKNQYRLYDALAADTFEPSPTTGQPRVKIEHKKGDADDGYMTI